MFKDTTNASTVHKVASFECEQGLVPEHEIKRYNHKWLSAAVKQIIFCTFDEKTQVDIEILVRWTEWTKYTKRMWPDCGEVKGVILENDKRIFARSHNAWYSSNEEYKSAPILCRDAFKIITLSDCQPLLEINGVSQCLHSTRHNL